MSLLRNKPASDARRRRQAALIILLAIGSGAIVGVLLERILPDGLGRRLAENQSTPSPKKGEMDLVERNGRLLWGDKELLGENLENATEALDGWLQSNPIEYANFLSDSSALALLDPTAFLEAVNKATAGDARKAFLLSLQLKSDDLQRLLAEDALGRLIQSDPELALQLTKKASPVLAHDLRGELTVKWVNIGGAAALDKMVNQKLIDSEDASKGVIELAKSDRTGAANFLERIRSSHVAALGRNGAWGVLNDVVNEDPALLLRVLRPETLTPPEKLMFAIAAGSTASADPDAVVSLFGPSLDERTKNQALEGAAGKMAQSNPDAALKLLNSISAEDLRTTCATGIARDLSRTKGTAASQNWIDRISDPLTRDKVRSAVLRSDGAASDHQ